MNGSFRRLADTQGIGGGEGGVQLLPADLDGDRDVDLVVVRRSGNDVWINDRLWQYRTATGFEAFRGTAVVAAVAGDRDADGSPEIYAVHSDGALAAWSEGEGGDWAPTTIGHLDGGQPYLALSDFDGDGVLDLLGGTDFGVVVFAGDGETVPLRGTGDAAGPVLVLNDDPARGPALAAPTTGGLRRWGPGAGRYAFLAVEVTGKEELAESMRSNRSGIGTRLSLRALDRWTIMDTFDRHSAPGQSWRRPITWRWIGRTACSRPNSTWRPGKSTGSPRRSASCRVALSSSRGTGSGTRSLATSSGSAASGSSSGPVSTRSRGPGSDS
jgi:hypothetical protein